MKNPYQILKQLDIPVGYLVNPKPNVVPFAVYFGTGTNNFFADGKVYKKIQGWVVELYTRKKDVELELKLENMLDENNIRWEKGQEVFISSEKIFLVPYYFYL